MKNVRIPQHVVYRRLVDETVMLNVLTGQYHGLNTTGGRILEALEQHSDVEDAIAILTEEFEVSAEVLRADIGEFCSDLRARGLIEYDV